MTEEHSKKPMTISRDALYKQVWQTPMSQLAAAYGISGNGLAKICRLGEEGGRPEGDRDRPA
jgi:hypothetical protein